MLRKLLRGWLDHFFFCFARSKSSGGEPAHSNIGTGQWESPVHHHPFLVVTTVKSLKTCFSPLLVELLMSSAAALEVVAMPTVPTCDMSGLWFLIIQYFHLEKLPIVGAMLKPTKAPNHLLIQKFIICSGPCTNSKWVPNTATPRTSCARCVLLLLRRSPSSWESVKLNFEYFQKVTSQ